MQPAASAATIRARDAVAAALRQRDFAAAITQLELLTTLIDGGSGDKAARAAEQAQLADFWSLLQHYQRAREHYDRAIQLMPAMPRYWYNRATVRRYLGELRLAEDDYDEVIRLQPTDAQAYLHRSELRVQSKQRNHIGELERMLGNSRGSWDREVPVRYALAKEYQDLGEHAQSWQHLSAGATLRRAHLQYTPSVDLNTVDWIRTAFASGATLTGGCDSDEPIFIIGMPRTGSTLVDRILSSHSDVFAAGELPDFSIAMVAAVRKLLGGTAGREQMVAASAKLDFAALGESYLRGTRPRTGRTPHFTDKLPINYLYAGLIARALPNARIVHVTRNAVATCYAMYKVLFQQGYPFSYDLGELADYYIGYRRLMDHWHRTLHGRIFDFSYETLVANPATQVPALLQAVGLSTQDACLEFHNNPSPVATASAAQVRRPIYSTAVALWRHYERELSPLTRRLQAAGIDIEGG